MPYERIYGEKVKNIQVNIASFLEYKAFVKKYIVKRDSILNIKGKALNIISELPNNIW